MRNPVVQWTIPNRERLLFLRSIDIIGFKSFARSTHLELPSGITALVGPNGSGKSNVVDAIRWCLGEQSMRDLRGQRAEDVIYAGPRRVMGFAEVTLTLEAGSEDLHLPSTLSIARRAHRNGETEYIVDGSRSRLRDVTAALRNVGVDAGRYVVVNQGMGDALLTATPAERRALLEYAAGLAGYRSQRDEARQKLTATSENMVTIETILAELEPRVRSLRRQAKAVQDREEAAVRLQSRLERWYAARWAVGNERLQQVIALMDKVGAQRQHAASHLEVLEDAAEAWLRVERAFVARLQTARAALHASQREVDAARFQLQHVVERVRTVGEQLGSATQQVNDVQTTSAQIRGRLEDQISRVRAIRSEREQQEARLAEQDATLVSLRQEIDNVESAASGLELRVYEVEQRLSALKREEAQVRSLLEMQENTLETENRRKLSATAALDDIAAQLIAFSAQVQEIGATEAVDTTAASKVELERKHAGTRLERLGNVKARLRSDIGRLTRRLVSIRAQLHLLQDYVAAGVLPLLDVPSGWERAAASAVGSWDVRREPELCWTGPELDAFLKWRSELDVPVEGPIWWGERIASISALTSPNPLIGTIFVNDIDAVRPIWAHLAARQAHTVASPPIQIVDREGSVLSGLGLRKQPADDRAAEYLRLRREAATLVRREQLTQSRLNKVSHVHDEQSSHVEECELTLKVLREALRSSRAKRESIEGRLRALKEQQSQVLHTRQVSERVHERATKDAGTLRSRLLTLRGEIAETEKHLGEVTESRDRGVIDTSNLRADLRSAVSDRDECGKGLVSISAKEARESEVLAGLQREQARLVHEESQAVEQCVRFQEERARLEGDAEQARETVADLAHILESHAAHVKELENEPPKNPSATADLGHTRRELADLVGRHERLLAQYEQQSIEIDVLRAEVAREMHVAATELMYTPDDVPSDDEIRRLRARANQYADADERVIGEYRETEQRYAGLHEHLQDLQGATDALQSIMAEADKEMSQRFASALKAVNAEFGRVFTIMLRGGEAKLELVDGDGGIGIRAQLPGKRAQSSTAFSGGERCLVASSLLFGVLNIRPTPFCVLDEVDAALDETNVDRYLAALRDISAKTQIIVVTHNRATMAAADALYGVTMDGDGVTGLLSLRLDQYEATG